MIFVYIKTSRKKKLLVYKWELQWQRTCFYIYKAQKNCETFIYIKTRHFAKSKTIYVTSLYTKNQTLYVTQFFKKILNLAFTYKNHDTFCYVHFYVQKARHFEKSKIICVMFLYTKIQTLCITRFFIEVLKLAKGEGEFLYAKNSTLRYIFIWKRNALCVTLYIKPDTIRYIFIWKKNNAPCITFIYIKIIV